MFFCKPLCPIVHDNFCSVLYLLPATLLRVNQKSHALRIRELIRLRGDRGENGGGDDFHIAPTHFLTSDHFLFASGESVQKSVRRRRKKGKRAAV